MIFTRTKRTAQKVADELAERGFKVGAVHGDLGPGRPREGAQGVPHRRGRRAGRHRRRRPRHRHRRRHPRHQLPVPRGRAGLRAPHRPHRPRRQDRHRGHPGRLGRPAPLDDDRQGARPGLPRSGRDLLQLAAPLRRAGHPGRGRAAPSARRASRRSSAATPKREGPTEARKPRSRRVRAPAHRDGAPVAASPSPGTPTAPAPARTNGEAAAETPSDGAGRQRRRPAGAAVGAASPRKAAAAPAPAN